MKNTLLDNPIIIGETYKTTYPRESGGYKWTIWILANNPLENSNILNFRGDSLSAFDNEKKCLKNLKTIIRLLGGTKRVTINNKKVCLK